MSCPLGPAGKSLEDTFQSEIGTREEWDDVVKGNSDWVWGQKGKILIGMGVFDGDGVYFYNLVKKKKKKKYLEFCPLVKLETRPASVPGSSSSPLNLPEN